jgi:hypothetical protein
MWTGRAALILLVAVALLVSLAPLGAEAPGLPMPDLVWVLLSLAMIRRPEAAPAGLVIAVSLVADLLRGAPLGLGTLALLAAREAYAYWRLPIRRGPIALEWLAVAGLHAAATAVTALLLRLTFAPLPPFQTLAAAVAVTALGYPPLALLVRGLLPRAPGRAGSLAGETWR